MDEDQYANAPPSLKLNGNSVLPYLSSIGGKWRNLGRNLSPRVDDYKLDQINDKISSDEEGIVKVIDYWINAKDILQPWRQLILALNRIGETSVADKLMKFLEPVTYYDEDAPPSLKFNGDSVLPYLSSIGGKWRNLGRNLYPRVPDYKLNEINDKISSHEEGIVEVIDYWINAKDILQPWRQLILALDRISETSVADKLMKFPKPFTYDDEGSTFNVENVSKVYSLIHPGKIREATDCRLYFAPARHNAFEKAYPKHQDRANAYASYAVNCHTQGSWTFLAAGLYHAAEIDALDYALTFLSERGTATQLLFTVEDISDILIHWAHHENWKNAFSGNENSSGISLIGKHRLAILDESHESIEEICHACASYYINYYPGPTERFRIRFMKLPNYKAREAMSLNAQSKELTVTANRLLEALKEVKSEDWDKIGKGLYISRFIREKILDTHDTADEQKEALLRTYANEQSHTSWWEVCSALRMNDYQELADKIKTKYIAPKFTQKDMMLVVSLVNPQNRKRLIRASPVTAEHQNTAQDYESLSQEQYATLYMKCHPKTSQYYLIRDLYNMGETAAIQRLQNFIFTKTSDSTLNAENVSAILSRLSLKSLKDTFAKHYRGVSLIPPSQLIEIEKKFKAANEFIHACTEYYVNYHPEASWIHLTAWIHRQNCKSSIDSHEEIKLVYKKLKQYLPPADASLTFESLCVALLGKKNTIEKDVLRMQQNPSLTLCDENAIEKDLDLTDIEDWDELVHCFEIPNRITDITITDITDDSRIRRISLEYFVRDHPLKSWWSVYRGLQRVGHVKQARYVKNMYIDVIETLESTPESYLESDVSEENEDSKGISLTKKLVLQYIQSIRNIRDKLSKLSNQLLGNSFETWTNEEEIVKKWLVSKDASWRSLIYALDKMGETDVANELIKDDRMEPVKVATMTTANVKAVFSLLLKLSIAEYFSFDVPSSRADVIERGYPDPEAQGHAIVSYYVKCFPTPTWEVHACRLYIYDEMAALDKLNTFHQHHQKDTTFTTENVLAIMIHWAPEDLKHTFTHSEKKIRNGFNMPLVLRDKFDSIEKTYESMRERYRECVNHYVTYHPYASWNHLAQIVYELAMEPVGMSPGDAPGDKDVACLRQLSPFLPPQDSSLTIENLHEVVKKLGEGVDFKLFVACGVEIPDTYEFDVLNEEERVTAIHNYVTWFPLCSWNNLIIGLQEVGQHELAENVRSKYMHGYSGDDIDPPVITKHPNIPKSVQENKSLSLSVSADSEGTLSYHWIKDGVAFFAEELSNCTGADTPVLGITSCTEEHEGEYKCVISNAGGSVESKKIELIVADESEKDIGKRALPEMENEDYVCVTNSSLFAIYLPKCKDNITAVVHAESVKLDLKPRANEIVITPVVHITSEALTFSRDKPTIVELMKIIELSEKQENELVILFSSAIPVSPQDWKELGADSHYELLDNCIRFQATQLGFFTAMARYQLQPLCARANLSPSESETSDPIELTIPGVSEFKMHIPCTNVLTEATVTATAHYDDATLCMEGNDHRLATACVTFNPQNMKFAEPVPLSLVIPGYNEVMKKYPKAELQLLSGVRNPESRELEWEINRATDFSVSRHENKIIAITHSTYLCPLKFLWRGIPSSHDELGPKHEYRKSIMKSSVKSFSARCQAFMSNVEHVHSEHLLSFNVAIFVYPFQASKAYENLEQYAYSLLDSGSIPYEFKGSDLMCTLALKKRLFAELKSENTELTSTASLSGNFCSRMEFEIELHETVELKGVLGKVFIKHGDEMPHKFNLRLPQNMETAKAHKSEQLLQDATNSKTMKLSEFCQVACRRDGRLLLNHVFKSYLTEYAESIGQTLDENDFEEKNIDEAFGNATYELEGATVHYDPLKKHIDYDEESCGLPQTYPNEGDKEKIFTHTNKVTKHEGLEHCDTKCRTWSTTGGLSAKYKGIGASLSIGYTKQQSEQVKKSESVVQEHEVHYEVQVPAGSTRKVELKQRYFFYEIDVNDVILRFPRDATIQCTLTEQEPGAFCPWSWCRYLSKPKKKFELKEIFKFKGSDIQECESKLLVKINGQYRWVETDIFHEIRNPKP